MIFKMRRAHQTRLTDRKGSHYAESVVLDSSAVCVDAAFSRLILAAVAPALFPRKRFRMSSLRVICDGDGESVRTPTRQGF
jgi:hypothetical protein